MKKHTKATGLLFFAAASVYSGRGAHADQTADTGSTESRTGIARAAAARSEANKTSGIAGAGLYFSKAAATAAPTDQAAQQKPDATAPATPADPFAPTTVVEPDPATATATGGSVTDTDVAYDNAAGTVEIHVNDANLVEVLRMLSLQSQKNIIASKEVKGTVTANLYSVTVREALDAILAANGYAYKEQGNFIYVYTVAELKAQEQADRVRKTQVFRVYYTPVATAVNMIKPVLSKDGELAFSDPAKSGLESGSSDAGGNSHSTEDVMVVTDYEDRLAEVKRILAEIDKRPQQILIEATILRATLNEDNAMGIDFQVIGGVDFGGLTGAGTTFGAAAGGGIINTPTAGGVLDKGFTAGGTNFTNNVPTGGLQLGVVKNNIAVFLEALETVTDTAVLANPKILALNKQKGEVVVGREDGYVTSTTTDTATVQTVEFLQTGTRLIFRPYIGDDGFIRMEIHPEDSSGGLSGANLPFKVTTEVTSNVMVRDGHTIVIGGLFREDSNSTRGQVPGLGNIPFAGALFRSQRDRTTREEIIILLTPHIVKDDNVYSQLSEEELHRMDKLRVGVRRGMMGSGRERLAEGFYDGAMSELSKPNGDRDKALWNLNAATNLNPKFLEAIELKQKITGREITSADNSISRDFVRRLAVADIVRDQETTPPAPSSPMMPTTNPALPTAQVRPSVSTDETPSKIRASDKPLLTRATAPFITAAHMLGFSGKTAASDSTTANVDPR